ncbi:hypothetical protein TcG_10159 [Trypanosoma cruzi]|nr:hypothetical protein TcG_10159 [Trypanosoma cruzi]
MRAWNSSCYVNCGQQRGAATLTPQSCCVSLQGWQGNPCSQLLLVCPQMLSLHANNVFQRVRGMIGFVCTLILFATLCGHATIEWWENGAGRCMAASSLSFTARWCGAHSGADSAM